ncbi:putative short chain dehydrogenase [Aspergillus homomorphus CBS 101889]|uniref:Putative short chain dehydrogenase n=1 Tax=Aspergillus homomorphus (strain CBS 101889) TaxID=1450537 RepID=A0A395HZW3_ASPHC|nr:putative short chain dehydrogenase [Aspergillus homomorphus CBS 101889]RAL13340.1 putative short chain dehydrogenase [Aspergillus homomorphus CBS 101889]
MTTTIVLITGANTGIGFQIVRALSDSSKPYHILVGARSPTKAHEAIKAVQTEFPTSSSTLAPIQIDIEDDTSIQSAYNEISSTHGRVDVLINNAGASFELQAQPNTPQSDREIWNKSWNVNTTSTQIITSTFIPLLLRSANPRLLFLTSGTATLAGTENLAIAVNRPPAATGWPKPAPLGVPAYRCAKTGLNMLMREWHRVLKPDGVKVFALSPGLLATGLGGNPELMRAMGAADPAVAGPFVRAVVEGERDADVGRVLTRDGVQEW